MTRSAQQPPASPRVRAESGSESEETAAAALAEPRSGTEPKSEPGPRTGTEPKSGSGPGPAEAKTGAEARTEAGKAEETPKAGAEAGEAEKKTSEGATAEPESEAEPRTGTSSGTRSEADPGAAAAAQSRLPGLVRTMTATAIGRPQQTGPVGRPGKAVLAGAAIAGALLVSVPFLVLAADDDKDPEQPAVAAGTVLTGSGQETPGEFAVTPTEAGSPSAGKDDTDKTEKPAKTVQQAPASAPAAGTSKETPKKDAAEKPAAPKKQSTEQKSGSTKNKPAAPPAVTFSAPVSFRSHLSGRCIDVPGHDFSDGKALHMWDCNNAPAQKWQFASDGTIRIQGLCLDVANANFSDGTVIQIARCNGNNAQKFALNGAHDLVNTVVGMCVDIAGANRENRAALQLLKCSGNPAQKWST
ncbi:ricin-type beta-trefoil lectin domain protein [Streptomyces sp. NPDC048430]|uniref:ricin-type beta-trefoil lectin domain protein n=1 Tax=Streptomyces sp. NPDC048430 TaxID=3155388 RepID=UPI0034154075